MAVMLNKSRILYTKLGLVVAGFFILFTRPWITDESPPDQLMDMTGEILVIACAIGRFYCTAFIGGRKNETLVTTGPFSLCRNPLYFCSFLGACGIGLISGHLTLAIALPLFFCLVYFPMIGREEVFLKEHFGAEYDAYVATTPSFWPKFKNYRGENSVSVNVQYLHKALKDSIPWFCALPLLEFVEYLQNTGVIHPLFILP